MSGRFEESCPANCTAHTHTHTHKEKTTDGGCKGAELSSKTLLQWKEQQRQTMIGSWLEARTELLLLCCSSIYNKMQLTLSWTHFASRLTLQATVVTCWTQHWLLINKSVFCLMFFAVRSCVAMTVFCEFKAQLQLQVFAWNLKCISSKIVNSCPSKVYIFISLITCKKHFSSSSV